MLASFWKTLIAKPLLQGLACLLCLLSLASPHLLASTEFPENYKVTETSLRTLQKKGLAPIHFEPLAKLLDQAYDSRTAFLNALSQQQQTQLTSQEEKLILTETRLDKLLIRSEEFSGDLKEGEATFLGNVVGRLPREQTDFQAGRVRILTEGANTYHKIIADPKVQIEKDGYQINAGYAVYARIQKKLRLEGNVTLQGNGIKASGVTAYVNGILETAEIRGEISEEQTIPVEAEFLWRSAKEPHLPPQPGYVTAQRIFMEKAKNQVLLEGNVVFEQPARGLYLRAKKLLLQLNQKQEVQSVYGEQDVCLEQPGRVAKAQKAFFDEVARTVLLEGDAEAYSNDTRIAGDTLTLYLDVSKGEVKGNSRAPIQVTISLDDESMTQAALPKPFSCK